MSRKKLISYTSGHEGMLIDCDTYEVELSKNVDMERYSNIIKFTDKETKSTVPVVAAFIIDWDEGILLIKYKDRNGSEMIFIHYEPSDLKGVFDFIGRGYDVFSRFQKKDTVLVKFIKTIKWRFLQLRYFTQKIWEKLG